MALRSPFIFASAKAAATSRVSAMLLTIACIAAALDAACAVARATFSFINPLKVAAATASRVAISLCTAALCAPLLAMIAALVVIVPYLSGVPKLPAAACVCVRVHLWVGVLSVR